MSDLENRLRKVKKTRFAWAAKEQVTAFRLYDLDMPEWPFAIDWYAGHVHVMEYPRRKQVREGSLDEARAEVVRSIEAALEVPREKIFTKTHEKHAWGGSQYERAGTGGRSVTVNVEEHGLRFECNLTDYLDTGLFLDHRVTRARVRKEAHGLRVLNLFAYTGAFTVHALAGGAAETTTVDLSNTYCDWAERNLALNGFTTDGKHRVVRDDVLQWLEAAKGEFDLIVLDPPSFSTSKKMGRRFEIQRDQRWLLEHTRSLLAPQGVLYFSTNFTAFELDARVGADAEALESLPGDFRRPVHRAWRFVGRGPLALGGAPKGHDSKPEVRRDQQHREHRQPPKRR